ncbi:MAG: hypothetical protein ACOYOF_08815 [Verrucomicrobiaceae bacterium]
MPTATTMDRYYQKAEQMAESQIAALEVKRQSGEISQAEYDSKVQAIRAGIPNQASELAWARHEIAESEKRSLGIPTGDHPVRIAVPGGSGLGASESFYRPAGQATTGVQNARNPMGNSIFGGPSLSNRIR